MADKSVNTNNEEQFATEMEVSLNMDQLSYICEYCGKVNSISAAQCVRCGKRRPRNEYVKAMNKIKSVKSIKAEYVEEQAKIETEKKEVANQQLVRLVESRVADEKAQIQAQEAIKLEQERETIKKMTAREAVLRIIAAENAAEERIADAERKAQDAVSGRATEIESVVADEREKTLKAAAQKLVVERAGIEEAAREKIEASRKQFEKAAREGVDAARDTAEKNAARRAVLRVIAAEKANEDMLRMSKNALQQAALERIEEERKLTEKEYAARFAAEKLAIEKAADERIKAEKEALRRVLEDKERNAFMPNYGYSSQQGGMAQHTIQPISIVPYLNPNQPVYQYNPNRVIYKFIPNANQSAIVEAPSKKALGFYGETPDNIEKADKKADKKAAKKNAPSKVRITSLFSLLLSLAVLVLGVVIGLIKSDFEVIPALSDKVIAASNPSIILAFGEYVIRGINGIFGASITVPAFMAGSEYYIAASALNYTYSVIIPIGFTLFFLFDLVVIIQSIARLSTGRARAIGFLPALLQLICIIGFAVGAILVAVKVKAEITAALLTVGFIVCFVAAIVLLVLSLIAAKSSGKKDNMVEEEKTI
ncbi:hypothetical protein EOM82_06625 [bacterium]|nr:hypothetical protein [bacterium]